MGAAGHTYGALQLRMLQIFCAEFAIKKVRIILRKCKVTVMKMIHVITLFLVILGGLHFALTGFGINLLTAVFGGTNLTILYIVMGVSTIYHVLPVLRTHLAAIK
jgi:uncharacterized membrane protein YuzA (DUF378 family)